MPKVTPGPCCSGHPLQDLAPLPLTEPLSASSSRQPRNSCRNPWPAPRRARKARPAQELPQEWPTLHTQAEGARQGTSRLCLQIRPHASLECQTEIIWATFSSSQLRARRATQECGLRWEAPKLGSPRLPRAPRDPWPFGREALVPDPSPGGFQQPPHPQPASPCHDPPLSTGKWSHGSTCLPAHFLAPHTLQGEPESGRGRGRGESQRCWGQGSPSCKARPAHSPWFWGLHISLFGLLEWLHSCQSKELVLFVVLFIIARRESSIDASTLSKVLSFCRSTETR